MFVLPQELQDKIFMYLDYSTLVDCRELQSSFVQKCTEFDTLYEAVKNGNTYNVIKLIKQGEIPDIDLIWVATAYKHTDILKWFNENRNKYLTITTLYEYTENIKI